MNFNPTSNQMGNAGFNREAWEKYFGYTREPSIQEILKAPSPFDKEIKESKAKEKAQRNLHLLIPKNLTPDAFQPKYKPSNATRCTEIKDEIHVPVGSFSNHPGLSIDARNFDNSSDNVGLSAPLRKF